MTTQEEIDKYVSQLDEIVNKITEVVDKIWDERYSETPKTDHKGLWNVLYTAVSYDVFQRIEQKVKADIRNRGSQN